MIKIADNLKALMLKQAAAAEAEAAPTNPNAGFPGVPATTSYYDQLAARDGAEEATKKIDSARAYQQSHPTELPGSIRAFIPTYSPETINRQVPIVIKEKAEGGPADAAAYYSYQDDNVTVRPNYASSLATGPTTIRKLGPNLGVHELTHAIAPVYDSVNRLKAMIQDKDETTTASRVEIYKSDIDLINAVKKQNDQENRDETLHDLTTIELATELSDEKYRYSQSTGRSTIMTTPEEQRAFRAWAQTQYPGYKQELIDYMYSAESNPKGLKRKDGYIPDGGDNYILLDGFDQSVWGQLNNLTPEQQSYLMGSIVKGETPQQPTSTTPYSQYQA